MKVKKYKIYKPKMGERYCYVDYCGDAEYAEKLKERDDKSE